MIQLKGRIHDKKLELDQPIDLPEGTEVVIEVHPVSITPEMEDEGWRQLGMNRLAEELNHPQDTVYDDWKKLYGV